MTQLTGFRRDRTGSYIEKDPQSYLDYSMDWSDWMPTGDQISTSSWTIETISGDAAPLTTDQNTKNVSTSITTVWLAAGTAGNNYEVTNTIVTDNGLTEERYFRVFVKNRSA
jgi:hypothetical protein